MRPVSVSVVTCRLEECAADLLAMGDFTLNSTPALRAARPESELAHVADPSPQVLHL